MIFLTVLLLGMLAACGENATDEEVGEFKGVPEVAVSGGGGAFDNNITVDTDGPNLKFAQTTLDATTGSFKVTFNNKAGAGLLHNWVLVKPGEEDAAVAESAAPAYVPTKTFIGHTETIDGGKSSTAEFEVAEAGTYTYLCTFPGHYSAGMKGTLTVAAGSGGEAAGGGESGGAAAGGLEFSTDGGNLKFDKATMEAAAGEITVKFSNAAPTPGLLHNWVLVKPGEEDAAVAESVAPDFVPTKTFIGHTKTIDAGKSDETKFTVEPGTYTYLCTFPGHYAAGMKGTLTVK
jgi:uncharacterized cupredoxin-like copper-binding protein